MEWILRMGVGIVLCPSLCTCLGSGFVCGGEYILGAETEGPTANPVKRREPSEGDPDEEDHMNPKQRESFRCTD